MRANAQASTVEAAEANKSGPIEVYQWKALA